MNAHNNEALKKIEDTWKMKLAAEQAEMDEGLNHACGLTEKLRFEEMKARAGPAK